MTVWLGTSGWQYRDWRGPVYPPKLAQARWLEHYVTLFDTVEVNNAFYRLPTAEAFTGWRDRTPESFVVTVKASRYLTHVKRLKEPKSRPGAHCIPKPKPSAASSAQAPTKDSSSSGRSGRSSTTQTLSAARKGVTPGP